MTNSSKPIKESDSFSTLYQQVAEVNAAITALERKREQLRVVWDCGSYFQRPVRDGGGDDLRSNSLVSG
jgi:UDP-N-acetylenolpyruvoylglucosamine reductase